MLATSRRPFFTYHPAELHRYGRLQEIARTASFLFSDDAGYIIGQNLRIDGGLTGSV